MDDIHGRLTALGLTTVTTQGTINLAGATPAPGTHVLGWTRTGDPASGGCCARAWLWP